MSSAILQKKSALIVFAREPRLGKVKTRLQRDLPARDVLTLYKAFVKDVLTLAEDVGDTSKFLYYTGGVKLPFLRQFAKRFQLKQQRGEGLGERLLRAFSYSHKTGHCPTLIIGTDCLTITARDIQRALRALERYDCVLGPTVDGGYYLIGLRSPQKSLFKNILWGSGEVLQQTLQQAQRTGLKTQLLSVKEDIDTLPVLKAMNTKIKKMPHLQHTRAALRRLSSRKYAFLVT